MVKPRRIGHASILLGLLAIFAAGGIGWYLLRASSRPRLILITLDTTRADHLGCYGDQNALTPVLDAMADEGILFERVISPAPLTLPAHASLLTGMYPTEHGLRTNAHGKLDPSIPTLTNRLSEAGYATGAFVSTYVLDAKFGLDVGFQDYDDELVPDATVDALKRERDGALTVDRALAWLAARADEKYFCWIHLYDPHLPYQSRNQEFEDRFADAPYDGEIAYVDRQIGRIRDWINSQPHRDDLLVIIAGDHGEGLGEHVELTHGYTLYESTQHVPMIWWGKTPSATNRRIKETVSLADVTPTVLEMLNMKPLESNPSGRSFLKTFAGGTFESAGAYSATDDPYLQNGWSPLRSLTTNDWKYIRTTIPELYDLRADPDEQNNLAESDPDQLKLMEERLKELESNMVPREAQLQSLSERDRRIFESLGYVASTSAATSKTVEVDESIRLPDVKELLPADVGTQRALDLLQAGDQSAAIRALEEIVKNYPTHLASRVYLGERLEESDPSRSIDLYQEVLAIRPEHADARVKLAMLLFGRGEVEPAIEEMQRALEHEPDSAQSHYNLGKMYALINRADDALAELYTAQRIDDTLLNVHVALGDILARQGRLVQAIAEYERELKYYPRSIEAHVNLGSALYNQRRVDEAETHFRQAVEYAPDNLPAHMNLGLLLMESKRYRDAIPLFERCLELAPDSPQVKRELKRARELSRSSDE